MALLGLPGELIELVAQHVDVEDFDNFVLTCRATYKYSQTRLRIHREYRRRYSYIVVEPPETCWTPLVAWTKPFFILNALEAILLFAKDPLIPQYVRALEYSAMIGVYGVKLRPQSLEDIKAIGEYTAATIGLIDLLELTSPSDMSIINSRKRETVAKSCLWALCPNLRSLALGRITKDFGTRIHAGTVPNASQLSERLESLQLTLSQSVEAEDNFFSTLIKLVRFACPRYLDVRLDTEDQTGRRCTDSADEQAKNIVELRLRDRHSDPSEVGALLGRLPSLTSFYYYTDSNGLVKPDALIQSVQSYKGDTLKKLGLTARELGSDFDAEENPDAFTRIETFKGFTQLEKLEVPAIWLIMPSARQNKTCAPDIRGLSLCYEEYMMHDPPHKLTDMLPGSLRYLGVEVSSAMDFVYCTSRLFRGFAKEAPQQLSRLKTVRFSEESRVVVGSLRADLEAHDVDIRVEVKELRYSWPWRGKPGSSNDDADDSSRVEEYREEMETKAQEAYHWLT